MRSHAAFHRESAALLLRGLLGFMLHSFWFLLASFLSQVNSVRKARGVDMAGCTDGVKSSCECLRPMPFGALRGRGMAPSAQQEQPVLHSAAGHNGRRTYHCTVVHACAHQIRMPLDWKHDGAMACSANDIVTSGCLPRCPPQ